jgi:hypothetical protein
LPPTEEQGEIKMALFLVEASILNRHVDEIRTALDQISKAAQATHSELIEAQIGKDLFRLFAILNAQDEVSVRAAFLNSNLTIELVKPVRLVGQDLTVVRTQKDKANYLVEWDLPAGLTMDKYLQRKAEKSPLYAQVPTVSFERTYVCEDLSKCLCFYDSPDEATVKQAREVVGAPIDRLTSLETLD